MYINSLINISQENIANKIVEELEYINNSPKHIDTIGMSDTQSHSNQTHMLGKTVDAAQLNMENDDDDDDTPTPSERPACLISTLRN